MGNGKNILLVIKAIGLILALAVPVSSSSETLPAPYHQRYEVTDDVRKALVDLYGGTKWKDIRLIKFLNVDTGYVELQFWRKYSEGGTDKLLVIGSIANTNVSKTERHSDVPVIGGAIFVKQGSKWVVESENKIIGRGGPFGDVGQIDTIEIGKDKYGVSIREEDENRGYQTIWRRILIPYKGKLNVALEVSVSGPEGDGPCENVNLPEQSVDVNFVPLKDSDYFNIVVRSQYNDGDCGHIVRQDKTTKYRLQNGKYKPI